MATPPREPITIVDGRVYAPREVTRREAERRDPPRERVERWT
jgi:hypothetical protein